MTLDINAMGGVVGVVSAVAGALWWLVRHAQKVGEWKAQREAAEARSKEESRRILNQLDPKLDALLDVNQRQSETLAVLVHRADVLDTRVAEIADTVQEHGARITKLEGE